jgi:hypothetical protein
MNEAGSRKVLDLTDVTLVDIAVVRFLICCEDEGVELVQCPPYAREWMARERAEEGRAHQSERISTMRLRRGRSDSSSLQMQRAKV